MLLKGITLKDDNFDSEQEIFGEADYMTHRKQFGGLQFKRIQILLTSLAWCFALALVPTVLAGSPHDYPLQPMNFQNPKPMDSHPQDAAFESASVGYILGYNGSLSKTTNGGTSWTQLNHLGLAGGNSPSRLAIPATGKLVLGGYGFIYYSTDGGSSFNAGTLTTSFEVQDITFKDASLGFAVGGNAGLIRTTDGGETWTNVSPVNPVQARTASALGGTVFDNILFTDTAVIVACGDGNIYVSTNNGDSWVAKTTPGPTTDTASIVTEDGSTLFTQNQAYAPTVSTDLGDTWTGTGISGPPNEPMRYISLGNGEFIGYGNGRLLHTQNNWTSLSDITNGNTAVNFNLGVKITDGVALLGGYDSGNNQPVLVKISNNGATFDSLFSTVTSDTLNKVQFLDGQNGWAGVDNGGLLKTIDGGATWTAVNVHVNLTSITDLFFLDQNNGWVIGGTDEVFRTTDGGTSWTQLLTGNQESFFRIKFATQSIGYALVLYSMTVYKTVDGGATWTPHVTPMANTDLYGLEVLDANTVFVVDSSGEIAYTTDGAANWTVPTSNSPNILNAIHFIDSSTGIAVGNSGAIVKTTDGGQTWTDKSIISAPIFLDVACASTTECFAVGDRFNIYTSTDGGETWSGGSLAHNSGYGGFYSLAISRTGNRSLWAVGDFGLITQKFIGYDDGTAPSTPGNPELAGGGTTTTDTTSLNLTWTASTDGESGLASYSVTVSGSGFYSSSTTVSNSISYTGLTLADGSYEVIIQAINNAMLSSPTATSTIVVDTTAPVAPTLVGPITGSFTTNEPTLYWEAVGDASSYLLDLTTTADFTAIDHTYSPPNGSNSLDASARGWTLAEGVWYWRIASADAAGNQSAYTGSTFTVDSSPPGAPGNLTDEGTSTTSLSTLSFTWTDAVEAQSDITAYSASLYTIGGAPVPLSASQTNLILCIAQTGGCDLLYTPGTPNSISFTGLSLTADEQYIFHLSAINSMGMESNAAQTDGILAGVAADVSGPTGGSISYLNGTTNSSSVTLTLNAGTDASGLSASAYITVASSSYDIANAVCPTLGSQSVLTAIASSTAAFEVTNLVNGTCYGFSLVVSDTLNNVSEFSSSSVLAVLDPGPSDTTPPAGGSISYNDGPNSGSLALTLDAGTDDSGIAATGYIYVATATLSQDHTQCGEFGTSSFLQEVATSQTELVLTTLSPLSCYKFRYKVIDNQGNITYYDTASVVMQLEGETSQTTFSLSTQSVNLGLATPATSSDELSITFSASSDLTNVRVLTDPLANVPSARTGSVVSNTLSASLIVSTPLSIPTLAAGTDATLGLKVMVPYGSPPGLYQGSQKLFADTNNNFVLDENEAYAVFGLSIEVPDFSTLDAVCPVEPEEEMP